MTARITVLTCLTGVAAKKVQRKGDGFDVGAIANTKYFGAEVVDVASLEQLADVIGGLENDPKKLIVRSLPLPTADLNRMRRLMQPRDGDPATLAEREGGDCWFVVDADKIPLPATLDCRIDAAGAIAHIVAGLPEPFRDVTCFWQLSGSAGFKGSTVSAHLFYWATRPVTGAFLKCYFETTRSATTVDLAGFRPVQPIYTARPVLGAGIADPVQQRHGFRADKRPTVDADKLVVANAVAAKKKKARGFDGILATLGDGPDRKGFNNVLLSASLSYVTQHGEATDRAALKALLREAIAAAPRGPGRSADEVARYSADEYLDRIIGGAFECQREDPKIAEMNKTYAVVVVGDKVVIMKEGLVAEPSFLALSAFKTWFSNTTVQRGERFVTVADHWLSHPRRRQYEGLVFAPGRETPKHYNLWRGFAVEARQGDCTKFLAHIRANVCRGDKALTEWVIGWFADIVQNPDKKIGTSLVLRGKEGTGKTKVGEVIGSLLGQHYVAVSDPRYITGRFNSHLSACLLLHAEEAFWAGDHASEGKLKDLITGHDHLIEFKGKEPIRVQNYVRLFVTGNPEWVVPVSLEGRRFAVLEIGEDHIKDAKYFAAIDEEMDSGGREALLHHLMNCDLSEVDLRNIPATAALLDQKIASLTAEQGWLMDILSGGRLPSGCDSAGECPAGFLFDHYTQHATKAGMRRRSIETKLGSFLRKMLPGLKKRAGTFRNFKGGDEEGSVYEFPALADCRKAFDEALKQDHPWDGPDEWLPPPVYPCGDQGGASGPPEDHDRRVGPPVGDLLSTHTSADTLRQAGGKV